MIALADYGASNTRSVLRALLAAGAEAPTLTDDAALAAAFDGDEAFFYHVHSYHPVGVDAAGALAEAEYGGPFPTIVGAANVVGVQFHPEKSQAAGLALLRAFLRWTP